MTDRAAPVDRRMTVTYPDISSTVYFTACDFAIGEVHVDPEEREIWFDIFESELGRLKAYFSVRFHLAPLSIHVAGVASEDAIDTAYMEALVDHLIQGV